MCIHKAKLNGESVKANLGEPHRGIDILKKYMGDYGAL